MEPLRKKTTEKKDLQDFKYFMTGGNDDSFTDRIGHFRRFLDNIKSEGCTYGRLILSPHDREVLIQDPYTSKKRKMVMFGSNNYLGFANHPYIKKRVKMAIDKYGIGIGGPPLLNGYTRLMEELEERLAALKHKESAMVFPTGYATNVGLITALIKEGDHVIFDQLSHASFLDAMRMVHCNANGFEHNNILHLNHLLRKKENIGKNTFVGVEGVYSMDGDLAPLDEVAKLCRKHDALVLLDDAHGTGVMGPEGRGTCSHFNCSEDIDIVMGTFSKAFAVTGGFLAASRDIIDYIRFLARSYMFSAALPPITLASVLAGIDLIEKAPEIRLRLWENAKYAAGKLENFGFCSKPEAAILSVKVPASLNIRKLNFFLHQKGIFLNSIEYPAVARDQQRLRISIMANHTRQDIDFLYDCLEEAWSGKTLERQLVDQL
jgi:glycine C-acetyltransferase